MAVEQRAPGDEIYGYGNYLPGRCWSCGGDLGDLSYLIRVVNDFGHISEMWECDPCMDEDLEQYLAPDEETAE